MGLPSPQPPRFLVSQTNGFLPGTAHTARLTRQRCPSPLRRHGTARHGTARHGTAWHGCQPRYSRHAGSPGDFQPVALGKDVKWFWTS